MKHWWDSIIPEESNIIINGDVSTLVQRALENKEGTLSSQGALVIESGKFTGRAAEDKYVVEDSYTSSLIDWDNHINRMPQALFQKLKDLFSEHIKTSDRKYLMERSVGADPHYALGLRIITLQASSALFAKNIFREHVDSPELGYYTIFHCPELSLDKKSLGLKSSTVIAINFSTKEILIAGTAYAGEMKKAVFSVMNTLLPSLGVLPMHSGANTDSDGNVSVFLGLSGTGKTTLCTDVGKILIGDDEHGISSDGIFNLEGGCYAKTFKLSEVKEPQVYQAVNRFGALLENVVLDTNHNPQFEDNSITENGRGTYPLNFISDSSTTGVEVFPSNIFFLSADAMGVLPAVAKLNTEQAMYYFLSGYTAKLAGTEVGMKGIKATFSHCFGAPFMMRYPKVYGELLSHFMKTNKVNVWMINTGWYGGVYGEGARYPLSVTRGIVRAIQSGLPKDLKYIRDPEFELSIPQKLEGVDVKYLNTRSLWKDRQLYDTTSNALKDLFKKNYKKYEVVTTKNQDLVL
jgi:phosphoenolpyruvate carboxykinase (ATP)